MPLREAAARLTAADAVKGKDLAEKLARDASPLVRTAAERTLHAWSKTEPVKGHWIKKPSDGSKPWWLEAPPEPKTAAQALATAPAQPKVTSAAAHIRRCRTTEWQRST